MNLNEEYLKQQKIIREIREELELINDINKVSFDSLKELNDGYNRILKNVKNIKYIEKEIALANEKLTEELNKQDSANEEVINALKTIIQQDEKRLEQYKLTNDLLKQQVFSVKTLATTLRKEIWNKTKEFFKDTKNELKRTYSDWDKATREIGVQIGLSEKQLTNFRRGLDYVAIKTSAIGTSYGDLAKMQGAFIKNYGTNIQLTNQALENMGYIQQALGYGAEETGEMVGNYFLLNASAEETTKFIDKTIKDSARMGISASKVINIMSQNLKFAQKYNFRDGLNNLEKMAQMSAKFRLEISEVAGLADKLFEPEGAVELAANLQVLGGEFSKLSDPFNLMFMGRNAMDELQESIIKSTKGLIDFNKQTGKFNLSAQELHRLKKIAEATNLSLDNLIDTAYSFAKIDLAKKEINFKVDEKYHDLLTSMASWDTNKQEWIIKTYDKSGKEIITALKNVDNSFAKQLYENNEDLKKRAELTRTFNDSLDDLKILLMTALLPLIRGITDALRDPIRKLIKVIEEKNIGEKIVNFLSGIYKIVDVFTQLPLVLQGIIIGGLSLGIASLKWLYYGMQLGNGFLITTLKGLKGGIGGGGNGMMFFGGGGNKTTTVKNPSVISRKTTQGNTQIISQATKPNYKSAKPITNKPINNKGLKFSGGNLALSMGLGLASGIIPGLFGEDESGFGSALSSGLSLASLGALFGPWGALIGGVAGLGWGAIQANEQKKEKQRQEYLASLYNDGINMGLYDVEPPVNDFILSNGRITPINPNDEIVGAKKNGPIDNMLSSSSISFSPINISGEIKLVTNNGNVIETLKQDPVALRELTVLIQNTINNTINGGKS